MGNPLINVLSRAKNSRVVQNSLFSGAGFAVPFLIMLLFTPTLVRQMGTEGYGLWSVAVSSLSMMGMLELGLGLAVSKFIAEYFESANYEGISTVVSVGLFANILIGVFLFFPLYLFANQISGLFQSDTIPQAAIVRTLQITSFGFIPMLLRNSSLAVPEGFQNFKVSTTIRTAQSALVVIVALLVNQWGGTIEQVALSTVVIMWVTGVGSVVTAYFSLRSLPIIFPYYEKKYVSQMFSFVTYSGLRGIGAQLFTTVDRVAVGAVLGLSSLTYYAICIGIANKFIALSSALTQALVPATSSLYASGNTDKIRSYFWSGTAVLAAINLSVGLSAIFLADFLLTWWMGPEFTSQALGLFRILILVYMLLALTTPAAQIANGINIPWTNTVGALLGGTGTILLIVILGRQFGLHGVGWANAFSWIKFFVPILVFLKIRNHERMTLGSSNA